MFRNTMPRYEVLSQDAMAMLDKGWRKLMTEIGVEFMDDRALDLFRRAGQRVEDHTVFLDPDFVLEQVAKWRGTKPALDPQEVDIGEHWFWLDASKAERELGWKPSFAVRPVRSSSPDRSTSRAPSARATRSIAATSRTRRWSSTCTARAGTSPAA